MKERKAIICFIRRADETLLIYDNYPSGALWGGISGYIDPGETAKEAAVREVKEETGLDIYQDELVQIYEFSFFTVFETYKFKGTPEPLEHGISEVEWFPITIYPLMVCVQEIKSGFPSYLNSIFSIYSINRYFSNPLFKL